MNASQKQVNLERMWNKILLRCCSSRETCSFYSLPLGLVFGQGLCKHGVGKLLLHLAGILSFQIPFSPPPTAPSSNVEQEYLILKHHHHKSGLHCSLLHCSGSEAKVKAHELSCVESSLGEDSGGLGALPSWKISPQSWVWHGHGQPLL